ncbi:AAA family ATPase [Amycolatopsis albispora]|uniref:AAA family ATPase n=1 Tax=Amycolatopsis albispora TaxID=1804986 RepID=UPI001F004580|nr:AAA family ATPase [Amycolatopsis albispora]
MRLLGPTDPMPIDRPRRIAVAGPPGSGKTTLAEQISARLGVPFTQFETFFHGPDWTVLPDWRERVLAHIGRESWAIEWQGEEVREQLTARTQVLVWLDHPRRFTMTRVITRARSCADSAGKARSRAATPKGRSTPSSPTATKSFARLGGVTRGCGPGSGSAGSARSTPGWQDRRRG